MSTLKTTNIQHPSAGSPNLVLAADGSVSGGAGLGGLVHLRTETFTAESSVSIDDVFSATYDIYRLIYTGFASAYTHLHLRLRANGSDATSNYARQTLRASSTTVTATSGSTNTAGIGAIHTSRSLVTVDIAGPYLAQQTVMNAFSGAGAPRIDLETAVQTDSTIFDGLTLYPDVAQPSRTLTGTLRIYGYANG
jgi:hypothetical protein